MSGNKKLPLGVPSPDEEALQEPAIDPIMALASLASGGIPNAAESVKMIPTMRGPMLERTPALLNMAKGGLGNVGKYMTSASILNSLFPHHENITNKLAMPVPVPEALGAQVAGLPQEQAMLFHQMPWLEPLMNSALGITLLSSNQGKRKK